MFIRPPKSFEDLIHQAHEEMMQNSADHEKCCVCGKWAEISTMLCPTWHPKDSEKLCCSEDCCESYGPGMHE